MDADARQGHSTARHSTRVLDRSLLLALALLVPALCLGQQAGSDGAGNSAPAANGPATSTPGGGVPAAELPGAALPGAVLPFQGLGTTGLSQLPAEYTSYGASAGIGETDNVTLSASDRKSQTLANTNAFFDLIRSGSRLDLNAVGNFSDIDYLQNAYGNQVLGRFDGFANATLWSNHLKWLIRDDYGDSQVDVLQALTPTNLQRMNVFSTGPDLRLQPTLLTFIDLQGLYSRNTWQDSPFSGNTETGTLTVGHQLSGASSLALVGQVEQERFDNTVLNTNYQIREYYGRYDVKVTRTAIDLQGGVNQANDTGSWKSSPLVGLTITRNVSPFSTLSLSGGRHYNNASGNFASLSTGSSGAIPVGPAAQTTASALETYANADWGFQRQRTTVNLFGGWERDAYSRQSTFDVTREDVGLTLGRQLTPRLSANVTGTFYRSRYVNQGFTDNFSIVDAGLVYRPSEWVVLYGRYDHQFRSTSGATQDLGYDENRVYVMIGYYPHSSGTGIPGEGGGIP